MREWLGNLGDGMHHGTPEDLRVSLIKTKSKDMSYWKNMISLLGFAKEV
jgi:hypothetical protein